MAQPQVPRRSLYTISSPARVQDRSNYSCCLLSLKKKIKERKRDLAASIPPCSPGRRWAETVPSHHSLHPSGAVKIELVTRKIMQKSTGVDP